MESPFFSELPEQLLDVHQSPELFYDNRVSDRTRSIYDFFGQGGRAAAASAPPRQSTYQPYQPPAPRAPVAPTALPGGARPAPAPATPAGARPAPAANTRPGRTTEVPSGNQRPLKRGSRVRHPTLGQGVVLELEGQGEEARITVFFEKSGKRKLVARFANLEML
jgi:hypothetical protein